MQVKNIKINFLLIRDIFVESLKGKSLYRVFLNNALRQIKLSGQILDLGSGTSHNSYIRFINFTKPYQVKFTDFYNQNNDPVVIKMDLEQKFPLEDNTYQAITCFNALEHIYNYDNLISQSERVLVRGGLFVGGVPFLINYHPSPNDYWRYSRQTIEKLFSDRGFENGLIINLAYGPFCAAWMQVELVFPRFLKFIFIYLAMMLDCLLLKIKKNLSDKYVLGYLFTFSKK